MQIGLIGASGNIGTRIISEGVAQAHRFTAFSRSQHSDASNVYRQSNRLWTYFSPAASIFPGERTGGFRLGGNQFVLDTDGNSGISYEVYAVALLDEAELPRHGQRPLLIGY